MQSEIAQDINTATNHIVNVKAICAIDVLFTSVYIENRSILKRQICLTFQVNCL